MSETPESSDPKTPHEHALRRQLKLTAALWRVLEAKGPLTLGLIIDSTGERAFGVLMAFICLPFLTPLPLPGLGIAFGLALFLLGMQLAVRKHRPWLPARLRRWQLPQKFGTKLIMFIAKIFQPLERIIRPRWLFMQNPASMVVVGVALALDGLLLSLPVPIPFTNAIPPWMAMIKILGISEEDGVAMLIGTILTYAAIAVLIVLSVIFWHVIWEHMQQWWGKFT